MWNPDVYLAFADHRGRPFYDLLSRVRATSPRRVVDLGCGPGNLTATLSDRWPGAVVQAVDSSAEMVEAARGRGLDATLGGLETWTPEPDTDVVVSNAALQWVPSHRELLVRWAAELPSGAWIAVQVPGNFDAPSHAAVRELASSPTWLDRLRDIPFRVGKVVDSAVEYASMLADAGCTVDTWETTYVHELTGEHPVLDWITGTALTPVRDALDDDEWQQFRHELIPLLDERYPARPDGRTFFPFRRIFVVAQVG
ncbi:trans-aconitate 2-methyltransferase [Mycolicibacterium madagascariense]|uniref:Trans-aconitate 2-methyltransferase n=1 Tax=Mycolicibacterium madagascariense TaxID=212765 RepID=A0A7I7XAI1_9MYCO|nr:trans-aconitate 2-methyltransferase [Mycolicibacterium madagascariense]MCV7011798.1 trans-aconitate 2-methyltransferase [Mycolicibacterium madagascariense]BBZ26350.1 trans-aconitate 2-methyltransferase [Mycolicibacterium madagascariense]